MNDVREMTYRQFMRLPYREWNQRIICDSLIILPVQIGWLSALRFNVTRLLASFFPLVKKPEIYQISGIHDSGFRLMDFVAVIDHEPICLLSGRSDVIHVEGITGSGLHRSFLGLRFPTTPESFMLVVWAMDCLPRSGLMRLFVHDRKIICDVALSSFEIYSVALEDIPPLLEEG